MRIAIYVLLVICALLTLVCYSLLVVASRADEREEQFYKEWKERDDGEAVQSADE